MALRNKCSTAPTHGRQRAIILVKKYLADHVCKKCDKRESNKNCIEQNHIMLDTGSCHLWGRKRRRVRHGKD